MNQRRRDTIKAGGGLSVMALVVAAGLVKPAWAQATEWDKAAFETKSVPDALKALGGSTPVESKDIELTAPEIAENGAVVPIAVTSKLVQTQSIAILIDKNPNTLSAVFDIPPGTDAYVSTRVKMAQTSNVRALVKADGKYYFASKEIKVTLGGCGG
jgi:sulfur-oxidizing protein SoxY